MHDFHLFEHIKSFSHLYFPYFLQFSILQVMFGVISFLALFLADYDPCLADRLGESGEFLIETLDIGLLIHNSSSNISFLFLDKLRRTDFESPSMLSPFGLTKSLGPIYV